MAKVEMVVLGDILPHGRCTWRRPFSMPVQDELRLLLLQWQRPAQAWL
jgi:hypothetical protein